MPGFVAEIGKNISKLFPDGEPRLVKNVFKSENFFIERRTLNKFLDDKIFFENDNYLILLEGVVLNKNKLQRKYNIPWAQIIIKFYNTYGEAFFKELNGSFSGIFYDKKLNKWLVFTDHIGSKHVYYSVLNDKLVFTSDIGYLYDYYKNNGLKVSLDNTAAYLLLSYGYMLEDYTLANEIKKLMPGHYIIIEEGKYSIKQYYKLSNEQIMSLSEDEYIEKMDIHFRKAIKLQFDKDLEYGYKHLVSLSGGLDSRMTSWVAHNMGYINQLNYTFSQSDYLDETIAKAIARDLNHEWIFKSLDGGNFLKDIDEITIVTGGNVLYYGLAHQNSLYKYLNFYEFGIDHSGQLGDVVFGTFYKIPDKNANFKLGDGAYSKSYLNKISQLKFKLNYPNQEVFNFYCRGFSGANNGLLAPQNYTETMSPFYNIDLLEFALSIPVEYRFNHRIYKKWILKKYPEAARYKWEKIKTVISAKTIKIKGKERYINNITPLIIRKLSRFLPIKNKYGIDTKMHMNPIDYWLKTNSDLFDFCNDYFKGTIDLIQNKDLKKDLSLLYKTGSGIEKVQVLSLLSAIKLYLS